MKSGKYEGQFIFVNAFDTVLAKQIGAGADVALMPSIDEPGGIANQELAQLLAFVLVSDRGGLKDFYRNGRHPAQAHPWF